MRGHSDRTPQYRGNRSAGYRECRSTGAAAWHHVPYPRPAQFVPRAHLLLAHASHRRSAVRRLPMTLRSLLRAAAVAAALVAPFAAHAQAKTLRVVPQSNITILDPIWTTAYVTRNHGYMI